jgi:hypothetical protein
MNERVAANIPFIDIASQRRRLGSAIDQAVKRVLDHGQFISGPEVVQFEAELAAYTGAKCVVTCSSGTMRCRWYCWQRVLGLVTLLSVLRLRFARPEKWLR